MGLGMRWKIVEIIALIAYLHWVSSEFSLKPFGSSASNYYFRCFVTCSARTLLSSELFEGCARQAELASMLKSYTQFSPLFICQKMTEGRRFWRDETLEVQGTKHPISSQISMLIEPRCALTIRRLAVGDALRHDATEGAA